MLPAPRAAPQPPFPVSTPPTPLSRGNCRSDCHHRSLLPVDECPVGRLAVQTRLPLRSLVTVRSVRFTRVAGCGSSLLSPRCRDVSIVSVNHSLCVSSFWPLQTEQLQVSLWMSLCGHMWPFLGILLGEECRRSGSQIRSFDGH